MLDLSHDLHRDLNLIKTSMLNLL